MQDARILVVEDEPHIAEDIRLNLEDLGYQVVACVNNGRDAVAKAGELQPDLVLMDIVLHDEMDGIESAHQISRQHDIPIVYLTAFADEAFLERAKITDPLGFILKPFTQRELLAVITIALYRARTERTLHNFFWGANVCASVPDPVIAVDENLRVSFLNQAACQRFHVDAEDVVGKKWDEKLFGLNALAKLKVRAHLQAAIKSSKRWMAEQAVEIEQEDECLYLIPVIEPVLRHERHVLGAMLLLRDVTAKHQAEAQARAFEQQSTQYLELSGAMLMALDTQGRITLANPAACQILGYEQKKILGKNWFETFIPKRGRTEARAMIEQIQNGDTHKPAQAESRVLTRSGEERVIIWTIVPIIDRQGERQGVMGSGVDITDRRRLEMAVERSRDFYVSLLERLPMLVWRSDTTGQCDYFNTSWLEFTGRQLQQELGEGWVESVHPDDAERVLSVYKTAFDKRESFTMEYRLKHCSGEYRSVIDIGQPIQDLEGGFAGYLGGCVDIEYKQRAERDLLRLSRALQVLSAANESLIRAGSDEGLLQEVCEVIVNQGGYRMAWIGLAEQDKPRSVRPVAAAGISIQDIEAFKVSWADSPRGRGPTGRAIRHGGPAVMRQIDEPDYMPWQEAAERYGYASSAAIPVSLAGNVIGALNIYAREADAFDEDEMALLVNLADDLSFGLNVLREKRELIDQTERNQAILKTARDGFWVTGIDGRILEVNDAYCLMTGFSREALLNMSVADVDAAGSAANTQLQEIRKQGHGLYQVVHRTASGEQIDFEMSASVARVGGGEFFFAFMRDISERKQSERALLESETKYRALFELANDAICLLHEGQLVDCNARTLEVFDVAREQIIGHTPLDFSPESQPSGQSSRKRLGELIARAYDGEPLDFEWNFVRADGSLFDAEVSLNRVRICGSAYLQAIVRDISERKAVEQALRAAHRYLTALYQASPDMIFQFSADGRLVDVNDNALQKFGYTRDEILKLDMRGLAAVDFEQSAVNTMLERAAAGEVFDLDWQARCKDGSQFPVEVRLRRLIGEPGDLPAAVLAVVRDMTEIRHVEAQLQAILDFSPALISIKDLKGRVQLANRQFSVLTGDMDVSVIGKSTQELFAADDADTIWSNDQKALATLEPVIFEEQFTHHDGEKRTYLSVKFPLLDAPSGKPSGVGAISTDITERKQAETTIQRERDFSNAVLDTIGSVVVVLDRIGKIVRFNSAAQKLTGYSEAEMLGVFVWERLLLPEQVDAVKGVFGKLTVGKFPNGYVNYWVTKTGEQRLIDWSNTVLLDKNGDVDFVIATGIDITDRQRAEQGLVRVETQWNQAIDFFVDPVYFVDMDDRVVRANAAFYKLTGRSPEQVIGKDITSLMHPQGEEKPCPVCAARRARQDAIITMEADHYENPFKRPIEVMVRMIRETPEGAPVGVLMGLRDLTRQRQIEEELRRHRDHLEELVEERTQALETVNKELEAFSYSVSHDLRAPLRAIDGFSQILLEEYTGKLDTRGQDYLQRVRQSSMRMSQLIDDLLMLSRVTQNELYRRDVNLSEIAETVVRNLQANAPKRVVNVSIESELQAQADPRLIQIVLENLLGNAWKFTSGRRSAEVRFYQQPLSEGGAFVVQDNGVGFDMTYVDRIFTAFQRLHGDQEFEGTGIGLATVQRIVHRHGGRVYARGEPGKGASIFFTLPPDRGRVADEAAKTAGRKSRLS